MDVLLLHLSDIHFREADNTIVSKLDAMVRAIANRIAQADFVFIVLSGDLTWSGQQSETLSAMIFLDSLKKSIAMSCKGSIEILMVPGNHDCDFRDQKYLRQRIVDSILEKGLSAGIDDEVIHNCTSVQNRFYELRDCFENISSSVFENRLVRLHSFLAGDKRIVFNCINSAWLSKKDETPGHIVYPVESLPSEASSEGADVFITVTHHPFNWLNPNQMRDVRSRLEQVSDLILTGHEHVPDRYLRDDFENGATAYIEGGVLQDASSADLSSFNLIQLKFTAEQATEYILFEYHWDAGHYREEIGRTVRAKLPGKRAHSKSGIGLAQAFADRLDDPGANFTHPRVSKLTLPDVFTYPDLRMYSFDPRKARARTSETISSSNLLYQGVKNSNRFVILGAQKSGRTALLKMLFRSCLTNGFLPIWLEGRDLTATSKDHVTSRVVRALNAQYVVADDALLTEHPDKEKVIFIDDIDKSRIARKYRGHLVESILSTYEHVIVTASDLFEIEELSLSEKTDGKTIFDSFEIYQVLEFGHLLRDKIIRKWVSLGQPISVETNDFYRTIDQARILIDSVIGKNLVPSYPFFLLALLQTYEASSVHDLRHSSYGYYYEYLILGAFSQIGIRPEHIDAYQNYLAEFAYQIFKSKQDFLISSAVNAFEVSYASDYGLPFSVGQLREDLLKMSMLSFSSDQVSFKYRYLYYFFIAKYLSNHLSEEEVRRLVVHMASHPHVTIFANILILLTYHSKDAFIVDAILDTAARVFRGKSECRLETDTDFLNELIEDVPHLVLESIKAEDARALALKAEDEAEIPGEKGSIDFAVEVVPEIDELDLLSRINLSFKLSEILGQISKNYYGSMKQKRKVEIIREAYFVSLRTLTVFFEILQSNREQLVNDIVGILREHKFTEEKERDRIIGFTKSFIFQISAAVSFGFMRRLSRFLGSKNLSPVFDEVVGATPSAAVKLIDQAIKLDHFGDFPYGQIKTLHKDFRTNKLAATILRGLVVNHLYMFDLDVRDKQRICTEFGIEMAETRRIDLLSKEKKQ